MFNRKASFHAILIVVIASAAALVGITGCGTGAGAGEYRIAIAQSPFGEGDQTMPARLALVAPSGESAEEGPLWTEVAALEDPKSNVFHKALAFEGVNGEKGILTIGGNLPRLLFWTKKDGGGYENRVIWEGTFGGKENSQRLRDVEIGDVNGDGTDEIVIVTHDRGVVLVVRQEGGDYVVDKIDERDETKWIHEVELGDVDGDGTIEILCTPSAENNFEKVQPGEIMMYKHTGDNKYERTLVEYFETRHVKEILLFDLDKSGKPQLFAALEGETGGGAAATSTVRRYEWKDGKLVGENVQDLPGKLCRFMNGGDTDGDGNLEIVASTNKDGIWTISREDGGEWKRKRIARRTHTSGFEHATILFDMDGDGNDDVIAASDDKQLLQRFYWDGKRKYEREELMPINVEGFYWNLTIIPEGFY